MGIESVKFLEEARLPASHFSKQMFPIYNMMFTCLLHSQDSLRRRFANALAQYQVLVRLAQAEVLHSIDAVRVTMLQVQSSSLGDTPLELLPAVDSKTPVFERDYLNAQSSVGHMPEQKAGEPYERPSAYLRSRCAACFGGAGYASSLGDEMLVQTLML
jgi:hypothetical protein